MVSTRIDREADGFLRGIIVANNINISGGPHSFFLYFSGYSSSTSAAVIEDFEMFRVLNSKLPDPACKRRQSPILMVVPSRALNNVDFPIPLIKFSCVVTGMEFSD